MLTVVGGALGSSPPVSIVVLKLMIVFLVVWLVANF